MTASGTSTTSTSTCPVSVRLRKREEPVLLHGWLIVGLKSDTTYVVRLGAENEHGVAWSKVFECYTHREVFHAELQVRSTQLTFTWRNVIMLSSVCMDFLPHRITSHHLSVDHVQALPVPRKWLQLDLHDIARLDTEARLAHHA